MHFLNPTAHRSIDLRLRFNDPRVDKVIEKMVGMYIS